MLLPQRRNWLLVFAAFALMAGMRAYFRTVIIPAQETDAAVHDKPRGNLSDLYPRWLGARELLLNHRDPYSDEVTGDIQRGVWGRTLDPKNPNDPQDEMRFAYPLYVVFLLAPTVTLQFESVVTCAEPIKVSPSPLPEPSQAWFEKKSILKVWLGLLFRVPVIVVVVPFDTTEVSTGKFCRRLPPLSVSHRSFGVTVCGGSEPRGGGMRLMPKPAFEKIELRRKALP